MHFFDSLMLNTDIYIDGSQMYMEESKCFHSGSE